MPRKCFPIRFEDGGGFICGSFPGEQHCVVCGTFWKVRAEFEHDLLLQNPEARTA